MSSAGELPRALGHACHGEVNEPPRTLHAEALELVEAQDKGLGRWHWDAAVCRCHAAEDLAQGLLGHGQLATRRDRPSDSRSTGLGAIGLSLIHI